MDRTLCKLLGGLLMLLLSSAASARVDLKVDVGWNGAYRAGRWAPVYITAADDAALPARNVVIEIIAPHDKTFALRIYNPATIRPDPTTILVYVPLTMDMEATTAVIRDPNGFKKLAERAFYSPPPGYYGRSYPSYGSGGADIILGVSGNAPNALSELKGQFSWAEERAPVNQPGQPVLPQPDIKVGYLDPRYLPDARVGYEALDALVLAAPDLVNIDQRRQEAIATWVRGGGRLIFWAGDGVVPADTPITKLLAAQVGEAQTIDLTLADTKTLGLVSRVEKIPARKLTPVGDAAKLDLLSGKGAAYFARAGMGQVAVLSFDASKLIFNDPAGARKFWRPIFHRTLKTRDEKPPTNYYGWNYDPNETRRLAAAERIIDRLGNVPGVGRFDFSYLAIVMIGLMFIVGPVDWWVLRKLGRQEWTWVTTGGWIALVTFSALYVGYVLKSGDLHYRTVRVIDQVDGSVVGVLDITGIYSPKTQAYNLAGPRECWWEPANVDLQNPYQNQRTTTTIDMFQDRFGQRAPTRMDSSGKQLPAMMVNVWNLRFMQSELGDPSGELPLVSSALQLVKENGQTRIRGTISNRAAFPLGGISIATKAGVGRVFAKLSPGQTLPIDVPLDPATVKAVDISNYQPMYYPGMDQQSPYASFGEELGFVVAATDMAADRAQRVLELLSTRDDVACIYGLISDVPASVKLEYEQQAPPKEQHWQVVRALVPLGK